MKVTRPFNDVTARTQALIKDFTLAQHLLYAFSKDPAHLYRARSWAEPTQQWTERTALSELRAEFTDLDRLIAGKRVLDYGCGDGFQSVALAKAGASDVLGVDIIADRLEHGRKMAAGLSNVRFATEIDGKFDVAISLNSFEHFPNPGQDLARLAHAILPSGKILITFGSPWLSPYGSHMNFFTSFPWVNVFFSERTVFGVRRLYRDDGSTTYAGDMNKMTIARFEKIVRASGLRRERYIYRAVKNLPVLAHIPFLREFFINRVTCILTKR